MEDELVIIVRIMDQGDNLTSLRIIVGGLYMARQDNMLLANYCVAAFLERVNPTDLQFDGNVSSDVRQRIESDLAALRESRPDVQKINAELLAACKEFVRKCECGEARSVRSYKQMKAAIRNAKEGE